MLENDNGARPLHDGTVLISPDASPNLTRRAMNHHSAENTEAPPLVDLLMSASETIREERGRADSLEKENAKLQAQLDGVRLAYQLVATQRAQRNSQALGRVTALDKAGEDMLFAYVRDRLIGRDIHPSSEHEKCSCTRESSSRARLGQRQRRSNAAAPPVASAAARVPSRNFITAATRSCTKRGNAGITPPESVSPKTAEPHISVATEAREEHGYLPTALRNCDLKSAKGHRATSLTGGGSRKGEGNAEMVEGGSDTEESPTHWMARRLLRALAPRPTDSVVGDIVHTMVTALQQDVQAELSRPSDGRHAAPNRMRGFALVRLKPCVYRLLVGPPAEVKAMECAARSSNRSARQTAPRLPSAALHRDHFLLYSRNPETNTAARPCSSKITNTVIHLTIDTGTLRVVRGGGHIDFIDYLERRLQVKLYTRRSRPA
ncbi:conserved hypothetical protein [Leishmania infantum JPCM5]|uniref:Uncharacterized protein n=2 Tax=Leishmania infantum TaxID=5671 RepID=A4HS10_LEIIN|nr:conserved hypothetical protein [Leishmania infantum JPCM5]CAC9440564.1 hypothetical_protein_-_conserved [Leishmania infantum]CAM65038.1 conserved hypothetical protein [Leishmania infantum JPCM5]SUZ38810.1 hypothetical_protein_-_conserved [Leishmania infantum]|eukprot:XP_001462852.1 conserved hypothetical protein [Leishmania infantum JPCM5]